jgi:elongation factor P
MATTTDLAVGAVLRIDGNPCEVLETMHRTPGNLRAFYQVRLRNLKSGKSFELRFRSGEELEFINIEYKRMQFLYKDGTDFVCMDTETYDQLAVPTEVLGENALFLKEGMNVDLAFDGHTITKVDLPNFVELAVVETEPGIRGDTATGGTKPAVLEPGAKINVPFFINVGDVIRVDTRSHEYLERAKS